MFDMDGVLIDSEPAHLAAMETVLRREGLPVPDAADWQRVFLGRPDRDGLLDWFALSGLTDIAAIPRVLAAKLDLFAELFDDAVRPFADGQLLARELHARGLPLALVSGARREEIEMALTRFGLHDVFAHSVSGDDVRVGKPDPAPYTCGARLLGVPPAVTLVVEDAPVGARAAVMAGAQVIVVDRLGQPERFRGMAPVACLDETVLANILARR